MRAYSPQVHSTAAMRQMEGIMARVFSEVVETLTDAARKAADNGQIELSKQLRGEAGRLMLSLLAAADVAPTPDQLAFLQKEAQLGTESLVWLAA